MLAPGFAAAREQAEERELIRDNHFRLGFILWATEPGKHVRYGELPGLEPGANPVWGLCQWSSKFPLATGGVSKDSDGAVVYSNSAKAITFGPVDAGEVG